VRGRFRTQKRRLSHLVILRQVGILVFSVKLPKTTPYTWVYGQPYSAGLSLTGCMCNALKAINWTAAHVEAQPLLYMSGARAALPVSLYYHLALGNSDSSDFSPASRPAPCVDHVNSVWQKIRQVESAKPVQRMV
jgi:hypothetical protein